MAKPGLAILVAGSSLAGGGGTERRLARILVHILSSSDDDAPVTLMCPSRLLAELVIVAPGLETLISGHSVIHADLEKAMVGPVIDPRALRHLLAINDASRVHLPLIQRSLLPALLARMLTREFLLTCSVTSAPLSWGSDGPWLSSLALRLECDQASRIDCLYDYFLESYPKWRDKCWVTPCAFTDYEHFRPLNKEPLIVFAGRLIAEKQPILALEAFAEAQQRFPAEMKGWRLAMYGSGELLPALTQQVATLGLEGSVSLTHSLDLAQVLGHSSVFLSLQKHENYPSQALLEALACGNVPVCTDVGATRRIVSPDTAVLVADSSPSTVAGAIVEACLRSKRAGIQEAERASVRQKYTIDIASSYYRRFLEL